jgi:hypothetical protein
MLQWLVDSFPVLGLRGQNWMLVSAGALVVYCAVLIVLRRRSHRLP